MNMRSDIGTVLGSDDACEVRVVDAERVAEVRSAVPVPDLIAALAEGVFAVLADPGRLKGDTCC
jgi:hypothetical protein